MGTYVEDRRLYPKFLDLPGSVYTRSGVQYQQDASGLLVPFDENVPPISTGVGLGVWEARTQSLPAPIFTYALPGDRAGVFPDGYSNVGNAGGAQMTVLAQESVLGINCRPVSLRRVNPTAGLEGFKPSPDLTLPVGTHVLRMYVRRLQSAPAADVLVYTGLGNPAVAVLATAAQVDAQPLGAWVRYSVVLTMTTAGNFQIATQPSGGAVGRGWDCAFPNVYLNTSVDIGDPPILQTNNAAATRGAPSPYLNAPGLLVPPFAVQVWANMANVDGTLRRFAVLSADSDENNQIVFERTAGNQLAIQSVVAGVGQSRAVFLAGFTGAKTVKMALRVGAASYRASVGGVLYGNVAASIPTMTRVVLGTRAALGSNPLNGDITQLQIINRDISDAELLALTA